MIYPPMDALNSYDPLMGGYRFLDLCDNGMTYHPGADLNAKGGGDADLGTPLRCSIDCEVVYIRRWDGYTTGFGNHLWIRLASNEYAHYAHCDQIYVEPHQIYAGGTILATCGKSGNQQYAHCHFEVKREDPANYGYEYWPYGQSKQFVIDHYVKPLDWWNNLLATWDDEIPGDISMLEDWQVKEWIMRPLWEENNHPFNPDTAIVNAWLTALRSGEYIGRPIGDERPIENGAWQQFEFGIATYQNGQEVSWIG